MEELFCFYLNGRMSGTGSCDSEFPHTSCIRVSFGSAYEADLVSQALSVDEELQPQKITRRCSVQGSDLVVDFYAVDLKLLRVSMSGIFDSIIVLTKTLNEFY
jgi:hypothetical protein